jgi:hypothetical protein
MRNFMRAIFAMAVAALLIGSASVPTQARMAGNFDGAWSVVINTARGDCGSGLRYAVSIVGGRVVGNGGYGVAGYVSPSGAIHVTVSDGGRSASGSGRLSGNHGGGGWRTSGGECSGSWSAARGGGY